MYPVRLVSNEQARDRHGGGGKNEAIHRARGQSVRQKKVPEKTAGSSENQLRATQKVPRTPNAQFAPYASIWRK
jgi:hypothetical protein